MATLTIRDLDESLKQSLRIQAAHGNRSMEEEARQILKAALTSAAEPEAGRAQRARARFSGLGDMKLSTDEREPITGEGQVTIPKKLRQRLGIRQGSLIEFSLVGDHVEMRVRRSPTGEATSGFGLLKSRRAAVPTDFDPAILLDR